jgi:hypothetical protein
LRNNRRWFAHQSGAGIIRPVFKRRFPAKINQHSDNKYFGKRTHGKDEIPKILNATQPRITRISWMELGWIAWLGSARRYAPDNPNDKPKKRHGCGV